MVKYYSDEELADILEDAVYFYIDNELDKAQTVTETADNGTADKGEASTMVNVNRIDATTFDVMAHGKRLTLKAGVFKESCGHRLYEYLIDMDKGELVHLLYLEDYDEKRHAKAQ